MGSIEVTVDSEIIQDLILGQRDEAIQKLVETILSEVLEAEMDEHLQAKRHERTDGRKGYRNGHCERGLTMRVGPLDLRVPRDREGTFETAVFERHQRSEKALVLAMMEMVVNGVSTRKVKRITDELCGREFSKSTVSRLCEALDEKVQTWNERPLDEVARPFVIVDAIQIKVRRQGAVRSTSALVAVSITEEGYREILEIQIANSETEEGWKEFFRTLNDRGLHASNSSSLTPIPVSSMRSDSVFREQAGSGVRHTFAGTSSIRHRRVSTTHSQMGSTRSLWPDEVDDARAAFNELCAELEGQAGAALETLELGLEDATAVLRLPKKYRKRLRTTNMLERLNSEIRRREKVIRIFPYERSAWRLIGAYLMEQHEEWMTGRRYFDMDEYFALVASREGDDHIELGATG